MDLIALKPPLSMVVEAQDHHDPTLATSSSFQTWGSPRMAMGLVLASLKILPLTPILQNLAVLMVVLSRALQVFPRVAG